MPIYYLRIDYYEVYYKLKIYLFVSIHILYQMNTPDREVLKKSFNQIHL